MADSTFPSGEGPDCGKLPDARGPRPSPPPKAEGASAQPARPILHVVLHQPDIPQNTGNIGRTCVAVGAKLWLVRPLGFRLDERHLRRAGMDYWQYVEWEAVENWRALRERLAERPFWYLTKTARRLVWEAEFQPGDVLVFGSETKGLPGAILREQPSRNLRLPMHAQVRSLNLASAATAVIYEAARQFGGLATTPAGRD